MKNNYALLLIVVILALFASCTSQKRLTYFNGLNADSAAYINEQVKFAHENRIIEGDLLGIVVSGTDPRTVVNFNLPFVGNASPGSTDIYSSPSLQSYRVDPNGEINFPVLGKIRVEGMTRKELTDLITDNLKKYVQDPIVTVDIYSHRVSVLGEVNRPGVIYLPDDRTSIIELLALAGDITPYGKKNNILISRETDGKIEFARLNLNDASVFTSPYFFVQPRDVIYVEPDRNKATSLSTQNFSFYISTLMSATSTLAVFYSISQTNNRLATNK